MLRRAPVVVVLLLLLTVTCARAPDRPVASLSVEPAKATLRHPGSTSFDVTWKPSSPLGEVEGDLRVFVHLLDAGGRIARTFDHVYPFDWVVGRETRQRLEIHQSALAPPLTPADYALTAGLYDGAGRRWALATTAEDVGRREYRIATVRVGGGEPAAGRLAFVGDWLPSEPGVDRQILARRWTTGTAAIEIEGGAGELVLSLAIPQPPPEVGFDLGEGEREPRFRVVSDCDQSEHLSAGTGGHEVVVTVGSAAGCRVTIEPRFVIPWPEGPSRSVSLESLYWRPAGES